MNSICGHRVCIRCAFDFIVEFTFECRFLDFSKNSVSIRFGAKSYSTATKWRREWNNWKPIFRGISQRRQNPKHALTHWNLCAIIWKRVGLSQNLKANEIIYFCCCRSFNWFVRFRARLRCSIQSAGLCLHFDISLGPLLKMSEMFCVNTNEPCCVVSWLLGNDSKTKTIEFCYVRTDWVKRTQAISGTCQR